MRFVTLALLFLILLTGCSDIVYDHVGKPITYISSDERERKNKLSNYFGEPEEKLPKWGPSALGLQMGVIFEYKKDSKEPYTFNVSIKNTSAKQNIISVRDSLWAKGDFTKHFNFSFQSLIYPNVSRYAGPTRINPKTGKSIKAIIGPKGNLGITLKYKNLKSFGGWDSADIHTSGRYLSKIKISVTVNGQLSTLVSNPFYIDVDGRKALAQRNIAVVSGIRKANRYLNMEKGVILDAGAYQWFRKGQYLSRYVNSSYYSIIKITELNKYTSEAEIVKHVYKLGYGNESFPKRGHVYFLMSDESVKFFKSQNANK